LIDKFDIRPAGADIETKQETQNKKATFLRPPTESAKDSGRYQTYGVDL